MSEPSGSLLGETEARRMAGSTGLEPAASGVTGRRSNQLNYDPDAVEFGARSVELPILNSLVGGTGFEPVTAGV
jgi:hypothetical protein